MLAAFLNGLINDKRGKKEGATPKPERQITNNIILMKLKIALNLQSEDIIATAKLAGFTLSAHELSSFMRRPGHRNYRECKDQVLRNFLKGLQMELRGDKVSGWANHSWVNDILINTLSWTTEILNQKCTTPPFPWVTNHYFFSGIK